jgi:ankyrin repeat protein
VEVVHVLIDGGADINAAGGHSILSIVIDPAKFNWQYMTSYKYGPHDSTDDCRHHKEEVKIKLIQILLRAGATVNPELEFEPSPLATAARLGYAEIVTLLITVGANVNFPDTKILSGAFIDAISNSDDGIPERDLIAVIRSLLQAGGDVQELSNGPWTVLEMATQRRRKFDQVIQLLLHSGARITQSAFTQAAEYCNLDTVGLFIKSGAHVTEETILRAAKNEDSEPFWYLLGAVEDGIKHKCKCAALGQCISDGNLDLIDKLEASGAKLNPHAMPDRIFLKQQLRGEIHMFSTWFLTVIRDIRA